MNTEHTPQAPMPDLVAVDLEIMRELAHRYGAYRQAVSAQADPVRALTLTREVLAAVHQVVNSHIVCFASQEIADGPCRNDR